MSDIVDFVITNEDWDKNFDEVSEENMPVNETLKDAIQMDLLSSTLLSVLLTMLYKVILTHDISYESRTLLNLSMNEILKFSFCCTRRFFRGCG